MKAEKLLGSVYFVRYGDRIGQFLIFIEFVEDTNSYSLLGLPESEAVYITQQDIDKAITHKVLEFVEKLPSDVFEDCKKEFEYRANN